MPYTLYLNKRRRHFRRHDPDSRMQLAFRFKALYQSLGMDLPVCANLMAFMHNKRMRFLHTMLRVGNLQRSIDFYTQVLGMQLLRTSENAEYKYSLAFLGFEGGNPAQAEIELTYNWGTESYDMGTAYGHIALGVPDAYAACDKIKAAGGNVTREAGPVKGGSTVIAFVTDPDGYKIELIQENSRAHQHGDAASVDPLRAA